MKGLLTILLSYLLLHRKQFSPCYMYRIYLVYEEYKRRYTPLDGLPEAIAEGKQPSGVYRVYTPSRRGISGLYNI